MMMQERKRDTFRKSCKTGGDVNINIGQTSVTQEKVKKIWRIFLFSRVLVKLQS